MQKKLILIVWRISYLNFSEFHFTFCDDTSRTRPDSSVQSMPLTGFIKEKMSPVFITTPGLKVRLLDVAVLDNAQALIKQTAMIQPQVKFIEMELEVKKWTGFTDHFTHLKSGYLTKY